MPCKFSTLFQLSVNLSKPSQNLFEKISNQSCQIGYSQSREQKYRLLIQVLIGSRYDLNTYQHSIGTVIFGFYPHKYSLQQYIESNSSGEVDWDWSCGSKYQLEKIIEDPEILIPTAQQIKIETFKGTYQPSATIYEHKEREENAIYFFAQCLLKPQFDIYLESGIENLALDLGKNFPKEIEASIAAILPQHFILDLFGLNYRADFSLSLPLVIQIIEAYGERLEALTVIGLQSSRENDYILTL